MIRFFYNEEWKEVKIDAKLKFRYAVSNYGRLLSFSDDIQNGVLLKGGKSEGFPVFRYKIFKEGKILNKTLLLHKLVAEAFLPPKEENQVFVLHLDHNKENNHFSNLKWATKAEQIEHSKGSPAVQMAKKKLVEHNRKRTYKLSMAKVQLLKKKIFDPNRKTRLKMIAKQFGITEMQLYRIKTGENWGHVKV